MKGILCENFHRLSLKKRYQLWKFKCNVEGMEVYYSEINFVIQFH